MRDHPGGGAGHGGGAGAWAPSRRGIHIPLVADIHFDYQLALECVAAGGGQDPHQPRQHRRPGPGARRWRTPAGSEGIPIRIGVNGGSLEKELLAKIRRRHGRGPGGERPGPRRACWNSCDFDDICISVKCSSVPVTMAAYRLLREQTRLPPAPGGHGGGHRPGWGCMKSAMGIGGLLCHGHRRHHPGDPDRRPGGGGRRRQGDPARPPGCGKTGPNLIVLPHLRPHPVST